MKVGECRSNVESELELEDPIDVDDMVFSEEEGSREVIVTSAEHRDPMAVSDVMSRRRRGARWFPSRGSMRPAWMPSANRV